MSLELLYSSICKGFFVFVYLSVDLLILFRKSGHHTCSDSKPCYSMGCLSLSLSLCLLQCCSGEFYYLILLLYAMSHSQSLPVSTLQWEILSILGCLSLSLSLHLLQCCNGEFLSVDFATVSELSLSVFACCNAALGNFFN